MGWVWPFCDGKRLVSSAASEVAVCSKRKEAVKQALAYRESWNYENLNFLFDFCFSQRNNSLHILCK